MSDFITCAHCGTESPYYQRKVYCHRSCKEAARLARRLQGVPGVVGAPRNIKDHWTTKHNCGSCGVPYTPSAPKQKYCSLTCNERAARFGKITCADCSTPMWVGSTSLPQGEARCTPCRNTPAFRDAMRRKRLDRQRGYRHQRRAMALGGEFGSYTRDQLFVRDAGVCGICDEVIDCKLSHPDPLSPSIDHVVPLSRGGHDNLENVQIAHLRCNLSKGNRVLC